MTSYKTQIKRILQEFDFDKCRKVMCALDWTWRDAPNPPTVEQMTKTATELMNKLAEEDQYGSTHAIGGFEARLDFRGDIELKFVVTEWDGSDYTNGIEDDASS